MFDTHVNLHGDAFDEDLELVLTRAKTAGVTRLLAICDRMDHLPAIVKMAEAHENMWCSAGVHPHHAKDFIHLTSEELGQAATLEPVVAIGETGLDLYYNYSDIKAQIQNLITHISAARATGLPIILHCRSADQLMGDILEEEMQKGAFKLLLHCYTGGIDLAKRALKLGAYFSVSGILSFKNGANVREVIAQLPPKRILLETDCPYLSPMPHRGKRNEPAFLPFVCQAYAKLMGMEADTVAQVTEANALALFHKVKPS